MHREATHRNFQGLNKSFGTLWYVCVTIRNLPFPFTFVSTSFTYFVDLKSKCSLSYSY